MAASAERIVVIRNDAGSRLDFALDGEGGDTSFFPLASGTDDAWRRLRSSSLTISVRDDAGNVLAFHQILSEASIVKVAFDGRLFSETEFPASHAHLCPSRPIRIRNSSHERFLFALVGGDAGGSEDFFPLEPGASDVWRRLENGNEIALLIRDRAGGAEQRHSVVHRSGASTIDFDGRLVTQTPG
eukprot:a1149_25.p1 GENE.a1149_25~~a1149_25.p1  ORF type:complete len:204 (-),score=48.62 a1149_25:119-676(-)